MYAYCVCLKRLYIVIHHRLNRAYMVMLINIEVIVLAYITCE